MSSRHFLDFATADWIGSRVRLESIMTAHPLLRLVYLEAIFALHATGRPLPSDPEELMPILGLPAETIAAELPRLIALGSAPGSRAGLTRLDSGTLTNRRLDEDREAKGRFHSAAVAAGRRGGSRSADARRERYGSAQPRSNPSETPKRPFDSPEATLNLPYPLPSPDPNPSPNPTPSAGSRSVENYLAILDQTWPARPVPQRLGAVRALEARLDELPDAETFASHLRAWAASDRWQRGFSPGNPGRWIADGGPDSPPPRAVSQPIVRSLDDARLTAESDIERAWREGRLTEDRRDELIGLARNATSPDEMPDTTALVDAS